MSLSVQAVGQAETPSQIQQLKSPAPVLGSKAVKPPVKFGSGPAATLSITAQALATQAKALAIKNGHDPDGIQDGK